MRRWLVVGAFVALLGASLAGVYLWQRHEDRIERTVHARLEDRHISVSWVSCTNDHTVTSAMSTITYYRCDPHADHGSEVCVPFVGDRPATEAEVRGLSLNQVFCEGQA